MSRAKKTPGPIPTICEVGSWRSDCWQDAGVPGEPGRRTSPTGSPQTELPPEVREVERKINAAIKEALLDHHHTGNPVAIWKDGRVVIVPPSKIPELIASADQDDD